MAQVQCFQPDCHVQCRVQRFQPDCDHVDLRNGKRATQFLLRQKQHNMTTNQQTNKPTNKQTNKQTNNQTNRQTNKQANKQTNKQTNRWKAKGGHNLSHSASTLLSHSAGKRKASLRHGRNLNIEAVSELSVREACKLAGLCDRAPDLTNIES
jgi:hypothetical protein